uniref:Chromosome 9 open reading frame 78 n=1 Tax=Theropithecus gelada TaxID=9565 RepID=A0A8D2FFC1_THEGE
MRPVAARNSPALATAPPPPVSQARPLRCAAQGCGVVWRRPTSFPPPSNRKRLTPGAGPWPRVLCVPGAGPDGSGALTALRRAGSSLGRCAEARRLDSWATVNMPVVRKIFRRRRGDSESEEDEQDSEEVRLKLEETREVQNLRKRPNGVSAVALLVGEKVQEETTLVDDPFQMKTGGMVDMKKLKERGKDKISEEEDLHLGTSFSAETNRRDEDADMMKYIETELKKRKGIVEHEEQKVKPKNAEDCLYELPENIRVSSAKKTEEMLSNQMLSGIPEVDLGIDAKIKNIISTEDAKARLLAEQQNKKKDSETSFVPTNMAVNYVQHNRFYHEELNAPIRRNKEEPKARPLRVGDTEKPEPERSPPNRKRPANEKATDDYHYEKFKKMNRRY